MVGDTTVRRDLGPARPRPMDGESSSVFEDKREDGRRGNDDETLDSIEPGVPGSNEWKVLGGFAGVTGI